MNRLLPTPLRRARTHHKVLGLETLLRILSLGPPRALTRLRRHKVASAGLVTRPRCVGTIIERLLVEIVQLLRGLHALIYLLILLPALVILLWGSLLGQKLNVVFLSDSFLILTLLRDSAMLLDLLDSGRVS